MKHRSIEQQLVHAVDMARVTGSKREYRKIHDGTDEKIFSSGRKKQIEQTARNFGRWIDANHKEVRWAKEIPPTMAQEWIDKGARQWTGKTAEEKRSELVKVGKCVDAAYGGRLDLSTVQPSAHNDFKGRVGVTASHEELKAVTAAMGRSMYRFVPEVASRCGARAAETVGIRPEGVRLDKMVVEIREGAKNGKYRDVPIREKDALFFADLKARADRNGWTHLLGNYGKDDVKTRAQSAERAVTEAMKKLGFKERFQGVSVHAFRRLYAQDRMSEEKSLGKSERKAWCVVQKELGHGPKFRQNLYDNYVCGIGKAV